MFIVTGGAGFIGSAIVKGLNELGIYNIIVVDELGCDQKWKNLQNKKIAYTLHKDELFEFLENTEENIDAIYHMGACSSTTETDVDFLMKNNFHYSKTLFEHCTQKSIPYIYASSAATYGAKEENFLDSRELVNEPLRPINPYGYSKQLFDHWVISQTKFPPFWAGLKFFNVYGPNEYHKGSQASVVFHAFNQISQSGGMKLFKSHREDIEDGHQKRDFVYVKDVVNICLHLYKNRAHIKSDIYNVGTGTARTFKDLVKAVFDSLEANENISYVETPLNIRNQYQYFTEANMNKLFTQGKYQQEMTSLEEGVLDYVKNYLSKSDSVY